MKLLRGTVGVLIASCLIASLSSCGRIEQNLVATIYWGTGLAPCSIGPYFQSQATLKDGSGVILGTAQMPDFGVQEGAFPDLNSTNVYLCRANIQMPSFQLKGGPLIINATSAYSGRQEYEWIVNEDDWKIGIIQLCFHGCQPGMIAPKNGS